MMRDSRKSKACFSGIIEFRLDEVAEVVDRIDSHRYTDVGRANASSSVFSLLLQIMVMRYSRGDDLVEVLGGLEELLLARRRVDLCADALGAQDQMIRAVWEDLRPDRYTKYLWWLAFSVAAGMEGSYVRSALGLMKHAGEDELFDRVAIALGDTGRPAANHVLYRQYLPLAKAVASIQDRPGLVKKFLDGWYAGSRNLYWHGNHRDDDSGYMGYWAFEAALVVMLFDIDDSSFRDHEYYPADLVAYYRRCAGAGI
ncbi:PoNe immunity protein domain-containing protein [Stenotrophomonas maltophilia]